MRNVLEAYRKGEIDLDEAERLLNRRYMDIDSHTFYDIWRASRTGTPELVLAEGKDLRTMEAIALKLMELGEPVIFTRLTEAKTDLLRSLGDGEDWRFEASEKGRCCALLPADHEPRARGQVAVLTGGTSDIPVAEEAVFVLETVGLEVYKAYDVGVAGVHRLSTPLKEAAELGASCYIVAAGREGTLPTLVSGLVSEPVIGVPVSMGYGYMGDGMSALSTMLQSCSPVAVVNIDAGAVAALMAMKIAQLRSVGD